MFWNDEVFMIDSLAGWLPRDWDQLRAQRLCRVWGWVIWMICWYVMHFCIYSTFQELHKAAVMTIDHMTYLCACPWLTYYASSGMLSATHSLTHCTLPYMTDVWWLYWPHDLTCWAVFSSVITVEVHVAFVLQARSGGASLWAGETEVAAEPGSSSRSHQCTDPAAWCSDTSCNVELLLSQWHWSLHCSQAHCYLPHLGGCKSDCGTVR